MKKINLDGLKNVLSPKEMKNVKGGSGGFCCDSNGQYCSNVHCDNEYNSWVCADAPPPYQYCHV